MRYLTPRFWFSLLLLLVLQSTAGSAQTADPIASGEVPEPDMGEKLSRYEERLQNFFEGMAPQQESNLAAGLEEAVEEVEQRPTAVAPAEGFSGRVLDTISDFLPYFQFAVNSVAANEDGTAVTLKLNPLDTELGALSVSVTASEPTLYGPLEEEIEESAREAQRRSLLDSADDFSDLSATLTYGLQRPGGRFDDTRKMFGRNVALYQSLILDLVDSTRELQTQAALAQASLRPFMEKIDAGQSGTVVVNDMTLGEIRGKLGADDFARFVGQLEAANAATAGVSLALQAADLDALSSFISNQPQATFSLTRQVREEALGPEGWSGKLSYEMGTRNFNRVLREYRRLRRLYREGEPEPTPLSAFAAVAANPRYSNEDKFIFSLTYNQMDDYRFEHPYEIVAVDSATGAESRFDRVAQVAVDGSTEWQGNVSWTRLLPRLPFAGRALEEGDAPRFTFSLEAVQIDGDPARQSHVTGKLALVMPLADSMALPITITYSDRPELLTDQDDVIGGHIGITYRMHRNRDIQVRP